MCITKGLYSVACVIEQPNWPVKGTYSLFLLSLLTPTSQSNGCHSAQLTAVSAGQQSIHRFKLPLPLSKCPLNLIPHLSSSLSHSLPLFVFLFFSLFHAPSLLSHQPQLSSPSLFRPDLYALPLLFLCLGITLVTIMMKLFSYLSFLSLVLHILLTFPTPPSHIQ